MTKQRKFVLDHNAEKCKIVGHSAILGEIVSTNCNRNPSVRATWYSSTGGERSVRIRGRDQMANLNAALDT